MPGYIKKKLQEYGHAVPNRLQSCPYAPEPKQFGATILYYARAVNMTVFMVLSSLAMEQTEPLIGH
jgi:hypothetical protein